MNSQLIFPILVWQRWASRKYEGTGGPYSVSFSDKGVCWNGHYQVTEGLLTRGTRTMRLTRSVVVPDS
jgi:hypothetical protein